MKKFLISVLCLLMLCCTAMAFACDKGTTASTGEETDGKWEEIDETLSNTYEEPVVDGVRYKLSKDYATVIGCEDNLSEVVIAEKITYSGKEFPVKTIGEAAFSGKTSLTNVTIPNSITSIGNYAFSCCTGLTSIAIPDSVTSIGNYVFSGCTGLTSVTIPDSVTSIGEYTFKGCTSLTSITIPNSVTSIGSCAFIGCTGLTTVAIPSSVNSMGIMVFNGCEKLTNVYCEIDKIPEGWNPSWLGCKAKVTWGSAGN